MMSVANSCTSFSEKCIFKVYCQVQVQILC
jgi:hypothetical protein